MPTLTREAQIAQLVRRGLPPSTAERIAATVEAREDRLLTAEEEQATAGMQTPEQIAAAEAEARAWWYFTPGVSRAFRRILDARVVSDAS
jgi:hypothetical protein